MPLQTFNPPLAPVVGSSVRNELKLRRTEFGDGYTQITRDGMNHHRVTPSLRWELLDPEQLVAIDDFLKHHGGDTPFYYTLPGQMTPTKFTCEEWTWSGMSAGYASLDATFKQSFDLRT